MERQGSGLHIDGFGGWVVVVIFGGRSAGGLRIISNGKVSRSAT